MRVCGECGTQWKERSPSCVVCGAASLAAIDARVDARLAFVHVVASFRCRSCGQRTQLPGPDESGVVRCTGCGMTQAFHLPVWDGLFAFAHALADLGFPLPSGRFSDAGPIDPTDNPFAEAGRTRATFSYEVAGLETVEGVIRTASLCAEIGLGVPCCASCRRPLEVTLGADRLGMRCGLCGRTTEGRVPGAPASFAHRPAVLLVPEAHGAVPSFWIAFTGPSEARATLGRAAKERQRELESRRTLETLQMPPLEPSQQMGRIASAALLLVAVGLPFVPRILATVGAARSEAAGFVAQGMVPIGNVVRAEWVQIPGCGCPEVGGGPELAFRMLSAPDAMPLEVSYAWLSPEGFPTTLAATQTTALPATIEARDLELAVSCSPTQVVYASPRAVSVFDRRTGGVSSNGPGDGRASDPPRIEGPLSFRCVRATAASGRLRWTDEDGMPHEVPLPQPAR